MKYCYTIFFVFLIGCASNSTLIEKPLVKAKLYPIPDFNGVVDSYITTDLKAQAADSNIILVDPKDPNFTGPNLPQPFTSQSDVKKVLKNFICPVRGKIAVAFILDKDGTIRSPQLRRGIHKLCDAKAIAAIKKATIYPARLNGKPVPMVLTFPIKFK